MIRLEQLVAPEEPDGARQIGQFQIVARNRVAQVADVQESAVGKPVEQFLGELLSRHVLRQIARHRTGLGERGVDLRTKPLAQPHLDAADGVAQEKGQLPAMILRQPRGEQAASGAAQVLKHQRLALARQPPLECLPAERPHPLRHAYGVNLPLVVEADFLQVVEQPGLDGPYSPRCPMHQGKERPLPRLGILISDIQRRLKPTGQPVHVHADGGVCPADQLQQAHRRARACQIAARTTFPNSAGAIAFRIKMRYFLIEAISSSPSSSLAACLSAFLPAALAHSSQG